MIMHIGSAPRGDEFKRGVLFDVDGTLVDSNYLHTLAWWQAFRRYGSDVPMAAIHRAIGMGGDKLVAHLLGDGRNREQDQDLSQTHDAIFSTHWPALRPLPGARDLMVQCAAANLTVVLATSAKDQQLQVLRAVLDADSAIHDATSATDVRESKPAPDILEAALDAGGLRADQVVFVGDSVWDVKACAALSIPCIGVSCGGTSEAELTEAGAVEVYENPAALLANLAASAIGRML